MSQVQCDCYITKHRVFVMVLVSDLKGMPRSRPAGSDLVRGQGDWIGLDVLSKNHAYTGGSERHKNLREK